MRMLQLRVLFDVQGFGLPDKTSTTTWKISLVGLGKCTCRLQSFIESLTNGTKCTIIADKNVSMVRSPICYLDMNLVVAILVIGDGHNSLVIWILCEGICLSKRSYRSGRETMFPG